MLHFAIRDQWGCPICVSLHPCLCLQSRMPGNFIGQQCLAVCLICVAMQIELCLAAPYKPSHMSRLETRTKEFSACASSWCVAASVMKVNVKMCALTTK